MNVLLAAMAFAVMMIIFSTLVTGLTETYLRLTAKRPRVLADSVLEFLRNDPNVRAHVKRLLVAAPAAVEAPPQGADAHQKDPAEKILEDVRDALTENKALPQAGGIVEKWRNFRSLFVRDQGIDRVDTLTTYSFLQRLAPTDLGKAVAKAGNEYVLRALTMGFERYVAASNEIFRKHAQAVTMVLSILLAYGINIDGVRLFQHFLENPEASEALIGEAEEIQAANQEALKDLKAALDDLVDENATGAIEEPPDPETDGAFDDLIEAINETQRSVSELTRERGLPIGFDYYPYGDEDCPLGRDDCGHVAFFQWVLYTLFAGVLIGLGGPFWYRVFSALSHVAQLLRAVRGDVRQETISDTDGDTDQQVASKSLINAMQNDPPEDLKLMKFFRAAAGLDAETGQDLAG
ncbi:MAG: hypothetical protein AAF566_14375 [Pseudomonadota bacterium]